jgi:hypothetical protein
MFLSEVWFSLEGAPQGVKNAAQILAEANKKNGVNPVIFLNKSCILFIFPLL